MSAKWIAIRTGSLDRSTGDGGASCALLDGMNASSVYENFPHQ